MKIKIILLTILLLTTSTILSQIKVKGIIKDSNNTAIPSANIQILNLEKSKILGFGICDNLGAFSISIKEKGSYTIKVTYLGYETLYKEIEIEENNNMPFSFILTKNENQLDELIIKAQSSGMKQKGDTLIYAVDNFMNGTEETLKDILKKLPGLDINANGKITSNGKEVDKLLIDGEEFFRNQHQLATENISSEMVKDVQLIKNYKDFGKISTSEKSGLTAVNISIKDEYKKKASGDLEVSTGYQNKHKLHSNLFSFRKKTKISFILENNNTGKQAISIQDYFSITENKDNYGIESTSKVKFSKAEDFPKFLTSQNNVKDRKTNFGALNLVYSPTDKIKINFNSIFNKANQIEEQFVKQEYFTPSFPIQNIELLNTKEINVFNSTQVESFYKPNEKTIFKYLLNINFNNTDTDQNNQTSTFDYANKILDKNTIKKKSIKNNFAFNKQINSILLFDINLFQSIEQTNNKKNIQGINPFLDLTFIDNIYYINQNKKAENNNFGYNSNLQFKLKKNTLNIISGSIFENETFLNVVKNQDSFYNNLNSKTSDSYFGLDFTYNTKKIMSYSLGLTHHYIIKKINNISSFNHSYFFPKLSIKTIFNPNNVLDFSYQLTTKFPQIETLLQKSIIIDYRNYNSNQDVKYNTELPFHQLNLNYFIFKPKTSLIINLNYNKQVKSLSTNNINNESTSQTLYKLSPYEEFFSAMYFLEKKITKLYSFTSSTSYTQTNKIVFTENIENPYNTSNLSFLAKFSSRYKQFLINFETGIITSNNEYKYSNSKSFLKESRFFTNLTGKASKNLFWNLNLSYDIQDSNSSNTEIFTLSPKIRYSILKNKWNFSLSGNNILNLDNIYKIENNSTPNYFQEKKYSSLAGYILFEIKYKL